MNDPIFPTIAFFLVLGAVIGWLLRQLWDRGQIASVEQSWRTRLSAIERERERLRSDLGNARGAAPASGGGADQAEALERELAATRRVAEGRRAEIERLQDQLAELEQAGRAASADEIEGEPPEPIPAPAAPDDLKQISGIGPGIERTLNGLGVYRFHQIAAFTPDNVAWVDHHLRFKGRIAREKWIEQARTLVDGETGTSAASAPDSPA